MPKPKAYAAPAGFTPLSPLSTVSRASRNIIDRIPLETRTGKPSPLPDITSIRALSVDKHVESLRYKIVYVADKLADDLSRAVSKPNKKDKEYIKGLVWSLGVLFDKLAAGANTDAIIIRIPARLLDSVKAVIALQASRKSEAKSPALSPALPALDNVSSDNVIETTGYSVPVADVVAHDAADLPSPTSNSVE